MKFLTSDEQATVRAAAVREVKRTRGALIDYMHTTGPRVAVVDELAVALADALNLLDIVDEA